MKKIIWSFSLLLLITTVKTQACPDFSGKYLYKGDNGYGTPWTVTYQLQQTNCETLKGSRTIQFDGGLTQFIDVDFSPKFTPDNIIFFQDNRLMFQSFAMPGTVVTYPYISDVSIFEMLPSGDSFTASYFHYDSKGQQSFKKRSYVFKKSVSAPICTY